MRTRLVSFSLLCAIALGGFVFQAADASAQTQPAPTPVPPAPSPPPPVSPEPPVAAPPQPASPVAEPQPVFDATPVAAASQEAEYTQQVAAGEARTGPSVEDALPVPAPKSQDSALVPAGESERMGPHDVALDGFKFTAGEGISIHSADKLFALGISFRFQLLTTVVDKIPGNTDAEESIQIRRARLQFGGYAFGEHNKYKLELAVSPSDVDMQNQVVRTSPLLEAYTEFDYLRDLTIRAGQYKVPFDRIRMISDMAREMVDFSGITNEFSLDRDIGIELKSNDLFGLNLFRYHLGIFSGEGRNSFTLSDLGMLYLARVEFMPTGRFEDFIEADFERTGPRLSIGGSFVREENAKRVRGTSGDAPADKGTTDYNMAVGDAAFKAYGFSFLGAVHWRQGNRDSGPLVKADGTPLTDATSGKPITTTPSRDGTGLVLEAGYLLPRLPVQVIGRYAMQRGRDRSGHDGLPDANELGGGFSYYAARHHLKLQADYLRLYGDAYGDSSIGNGANQVRVQLQMVL